MNRLGALGAVLAFISVCHTAPQISTVVVDHGNVGIGVIASGTFGPGSFSIGRDGSSHRGQTHIYENEDGDNEPIFIQTPNHQVQQDKNRRPQHDNAEPNKSGGTDSGNTQPVKPLTTLFNTDRDDSNSENNGFPSAGIAFSSGGNIAIGITGGNFGLETLSFNNKRPRPNVPQQQSAANNGDIGYQNTDNEAPFSIGHGVSVYSPDASALEAIFGSNSRNKKLSSVGNGFSNSGQGGVAIGAITGSQFGEGTLSLNKKRPGANVPQQQSAANNGDIGYQYTDNEAPFSIGHGVSVYSPDASALEAIFGSNSGNKELSSVGNGFSNSGQGGVAIGAITGSQFGEGTLSLNKKRPGANVPQQQSAANNGDIGYQYTDNEAPFSIGHGVSVYRPDASVLEAIFGSNSGNNEPSSVGNGFSNGGQGSVAIGAITGGQFGEGTLSLNNKRPGTNVPQQQNAADNGDIGNQNTENEAPLSIGHGVSVYRPDASALEAIFGSNSGNNEPSSVGNGFSNGGQGSVAIGAITGGQFGEGTLSPNNKRPGANVPQQQSIVDNETTGYHNTGNEASRSIEHGANSNGNGNAEVGYNDGQSSTGYNAYNNEEPWIWNR